MARRRGYDDDDGRTIADMSGLERPRMLLPRLPRQKAAPAPPEEEDREEPERFWEQRKDEMAPEDRRVYVLAALRAGLLIGGVFLLGGAVLVLVLLALWT